MPTAPPHVCPTCHTPITGPCPTCTLPRRREIDRARGTAQQRGYGRRHRIRFRAAVLRRDPICRCTDTTCRAHRDHAECRALSTVADHHPRTRRELVELGLDPDDPQHGRGLCEACHNHATATDERTRGGWHRDTRQHPG